MKCHELCQISADGDCSKLSPVSTLTVPAAGAECCVVMLVGGVTWCVSGDQCSGQSERRGTSSVETEDRGGCQHSVSSREPDSHLQSWEMGKLVLKVRQLIELNWGIDEKVDFDLLKHFELFVKLDF